MLNSADVRWRIFVRRVISKSLQSHLDWDLVIQPFLSRLAFGQTRYRDFVFESRKSRYVIEVSEAYAIVWSKSGIGSCYEGAVAEKSCH
jgi:hypothetical protein